MRKLAAIAVVLASFGLGAVAQAAGGWKVFAAGTDSGTYGAFASANADVLAPHALAVRASKAATMSWNLICSRSDFKVAANQVVTVTVAQATKCSLFGNANTDNAGKLKLELLRR